MPGLNVLNEGTTSSYRFVYYSYKRHFCRHSSEKVDQTLTALLRYKTLSLHTFENSLQQIDMPQYNFLDYNGWHTMQS